MYRRGLTRRIPSGTLRARNACVCAFGLHRGTAARAGPRAAVFYFGAVGIVGTYFRVVLP